MARRLLCHAAIFHRHLHDGAAVELAHRRAIQFLPGRRAFRHRWQASLLAARDLFVGDQGVAGALGEIDANAIAGAQPREAAAGGAGSTAARATGAVLTILPSIGLWVTKSGSRGSPPPPKSLQPAKASGARSTQICHFARFMTQPEKRDVALLSSNGTRSGLQ